MDTIAATRRFDLKDAQWAVLEPLLPQPKRSGRPSVWTRRQLIDGMRWRVRWAHRGATCRHAVDHGRPVYCLFRRWQRDGTWQPILTALQGLADAAGRIVWDVSVDSTIARAHQHAAGARERGICRPNRPAGSATSRPITRWVAPAMG